MKRFAKKSKNLSTLSEIQASVIKEFVNETDSFIKYLSGTADYLNEIPLLFPSSDLIVIDLKKTVNPLAPFLDILSSFNISESLLDDFCYFPQKKTFKSFLTKKSCDRRWDIFVSDDLNFEKKTMRQTIISIIEEACDKNFLILNTQRIGDEALEILRDLEKADIKNSFTFCVDSLDEDNISDSFKTFFEEKASDLNYLNITDESDKNPGIIDYSNDLLSKLSYSQLMTVFINNRSFLAISENKKIADFFAASSQSFNFYSEQLRSIYKEIALSYYYSENFDEAILYFNNVIEGARTDNLAAEVYMFLSKVFLKKRNMSQAVKYALLSKQICEEIEYTELYPLALMMEFLTTDRYEKDTSLALYKKTLKALKNSGYTINFINVTSMIPWSIIDSEECHDFLLECLTTAEELAKQIDDVPGIASCTHWKAVIYSNFGEHDKAHFLYNESNRLRTQMGELPPLLKIRNGLSYEALCRADYYESYTLINSIIGRIYEIKEYSSVINTLRNCAFALFYARQFDKAYSLFHQILKYYQILHDEIPLSSSFMPSICDIQLYRTYIEFDNGDYVHAKNNCNILAKKLAEINEIERPVLNLVRAVILLNEGNVEESEEVLNKGIEILKGFKSGQEHRIVFICYEYACALQKLGYSQKASEYIGRGFELAKKCHFTYYTKNKSSMTTEEYLSDVKVFEPLDLNLEYLEVKIEKEGLINQLHNRIYEYQFLNKIMTFGSESSKLEPFLNHAVELLMDYSLVDAIFIGEKTEAGWKILASENNSNVELCPGCWDVCYEKAVYEGISSLSYDNSYHHYFRNISRFDFTGGIIIVPRKLTLISLENLNVLNLAISNIQAQIVMIKQEEHLLYLSSTDLLSMLKNRRALQEYIATESEKLQRYTPKRHFDLVETIAFIDLDNFKYYNDTFGHESGDLLITLFSKLLKKVCRTVDFISRFGGDEFVVVMTDTNCDEGKIMGQRLRNALNEADHFLPELRALLGSDIDISKSNLLGFSMGLCSNIDLPEGKRYDLATVMMNADHALYDAKERGKGLVSVWSEIVNRK